MKKVKITFWVITLGLLGILVYQNRDYFFTKHSLSIDLIFLHRVTPDVANLVIIAVFFIVGLLFALLFNLLERYKLTRTIKTLRNDVKSSQEMIAQMKNELEGLKKPMESETASQSSEVTQHEPSETEHTQNIKS